MINKLKKKNREDGFTLVEVMVVLVIIALLTTFVVANVAPTQNKAKVRKAKADIRLLEQAVEMYYLDMAEYPDQTAGLQALKTLPGNAPNTERYREGGYIKFLPDDPWEQPYIYVYPGENGVFDIMSYGSDKEPGGEKLAADIVSWQP